MNKKSIKVNQQQLFLLATPFVTDLTPGLLDVS